MSRQREADSVLVMPQRRSNGRVWLSWLLVCVLSLVLCNAQAATPSTPVWPSLEEQVLNWLVSTHGPHASQTVVMPLDPRIEERQCQHPWQIDQPFARPDTLRARCTQPVWQVFVQLQLDPRLASTPDHRAAKSTTAAPDQLVVVTTTNLPRGTPLEAEHLTLSEQPAGTRGTSAYLNAIDEALNHETVRDLSAGQALRHSDLRQAWLVRKGQTVVLTWEPAPGLQITARLEAMEDGRFGDSIRLRNRESGHVTHGQVTGRNAAKGI